MNQEQFWSQVEKTESCWLWVGGRIPSGYGMVWDGSKQIGAHRWIWQELLGELPAGTQVHHRCDNPPCVKPSHLFVGSVADNNADKMAKFRYVKGNDHPKSKLTPDQVVAIRVRLAAGERNVNLAREFEVSAALIGHIKRGRNWRHLTASP